MKWHTIALLAPLLLSSVALATKPSEPLPKELPIEGQPVAHLRFSDERGAHLLVVTETEVTSKATPDGDHVTSKKLFGYHLTQKPPAKKGSTRRGTREAAKQDHRWQVLWQTKDFVLDCPVDLTLAVEPGSLGVSDVDKDGVMETRFAYRLGCRGDVSPLGLKLLFHEGTQKLAVRGTTREHVGDDDGKPVYEGGEHTLDPGFAKGPKGLEALAIREWRRLTGQ